MSTKVEPWDDSFLDIEDYQVERALTRASLEAISRCRRFGTSYVIEEEGRTKLVKPQETEPYEKQLLEELERLNHKIAQLQAQNPNALSLNETPPKPKN
jgi:hypothetical protein